MFSDFDSENLIKELSTVLQSHVYLPADYIINKGDIGEQETEIGEQETEVGEQETESENTIQVIAKEGETEGYVTALIVFVAEKYFHAVRDIRKDDVGVGIMGVGVSE